MNNLEELIKEHCPDGVEYKKLSKVASVERGKRVVREQLPKEGKYLVFQNSLTPLGFYNQCNYKANTTYVIGAGAAGDIGFSKNDFWAADDCFPIVCSSALNDRYAYHFLLSKQQIIYGKVRRGSIPRLSRQVIEDIEIPVPPIEVQREIVRVLDNFTFLSAELSAELSARRKQYEYYRDSLFSFEEEIEWKPISAVIESVKTGLNPRKNFKLNEDGAECYYVTGKDVFDNSINISERTDRITKTAVDLINRRANLHDNILMFVSTGTGTVGRMTVVEHYSGNWNVSETMYIITVKERFVLTKYLFHFLYSSAAKMQFEPKITKGSVPHLKVADLLSVKIPVPSLDQQQEVIRLLDHFDKLCNDLSSGLPSEIEARQKQYEFYRDKLLSFKEKKPNP